MDKIKILNYAFIIHHKSFFNIIAIRQMNKLLRILRYLRELRWKYYWKSSIVRVKNNAQFSIEENVTIRNCNIWVGENCELIIKGNAVLKNISLYINDGTVLISDHVRIIGESKKKLSQYIINEGSITIGHHSKLLCNRVWIRFGGVLKIGCYTNINNGSEIRTDESVNIGDYCRISYYVKIWDTNTHNIYPALTRRELNRSHWPSFGIEYERPKTLPVLIGNDCWIGEEASILKGCTLEDEVIVGYQTILIGKKIKARHTVVQNIEYKIIERYE